MTIDTLNAAAARVAATGSNTREETPGTPSRQAWQREMERAQRSSWFQPPLEAPVAGTVIHADAPTQPALSRVDLGHMSGPTFGPVAAPSAHPRPPAHTHVPVHGRIPAPAQVAHQAPPSPEPAPWAALRRAVATVVVAHAGTQEAAPAHPSPSTGPGGVGGSGAPVPPGLSVHIEPTAQGVAVWVGLFSDPDTPLPQRLDALLQALRQRLNQDGAALRSLTVNGRVVWSAPSNQQISNNALKEV